jgi:hypothetical protein
MIAAGRSLVRLGPSRVNRLLAALVTLTFVLLAGAAGVTYVAYQRATAELVLERNQELAYFSANRLEDELAKLAEPLDGLARTQAMSMGRFADQRDALLAASSRLAVFDGGVVLLDSRGLVIGTEPWRPEILGRDWSDRRYFNQLLISPNTYFSDIVADGPGDTEVVVVSVPIRGGQGEFVGALAGMFKLGEQTVSSLYASIVRLRLPPSASIYLADGEGRVVYDSHGAATGAMLPQFGLDESLLQASVAYRARKAAGRAIVASSAQVPGTRWTLVLEEDWAVLTASTQRYASVLIGLLGSGMLLPTMGVALLWRQRNAQLLERELAEQEARLAHLMHAALLPKVIPTLPGWMLAAYHQPAAESGQTFYDLLITPDGRLMLVMGETDLAGSAGTMAMSIARSSLRMAARARLSADEALRQANAALFPELPAEGCFACVYAVLEPSSGRLEYATAGFAPPSSPGQPDPDSAPASPALGKELSASYTSAEIDITPGGQVLLCGGWEISSLRGEPLSPERAHELLRGLPEECDDPSELFGTVLREFLGYPSALESDLTVVALRRRSQG